MNGNSIIFTDEQHDAHYADLCAGCGEVFTKSNPCKFQDEGGFDFCEGCSNELETNKDE